MTKRFEVLNLSAIRLALDDHNQRCPVPASAILLNPVDHGLLGWEHLWGLPVLADERVPVKRIRIECSGSAWRLEDELGAFLQTEDDAPVDSAKQRGFSN